MGTYKNARVTTKVILVVMMIFSVCAHADSKRITGTFSSLQYNDESGDLLGYEILIIPTDLGFKGIIQVGEGAPGEVYIVKVTNNNGQIQFDIPLGAGVASKFSGHIEGGYLVGDVVSPSGKEHVKLKRGISYWDKEGNAP